MPRLALQRTHSAWRASSQEGAARGNTGVCERQRCVCGTTYGIWEVILLCTSSQGLRLSIMICVSPLTALMMEQRDKLCTRGVSAEFVGELQQDISSMKGVESGQYQVVYISPEALIRNPQWREMLLSRPYRDNLVAYVIDEAHCIKKW